MKLPLIVRNQHGEIYSVLQFDGGFAVAVNPKTCKVEQLRLFNITALSEAEYEEWKQKGEP